MAKAVILHIIEAKFAPCIVIRNPSRDPIIEIMILRKYFHIRLDNMQYF
jgi:hypothetical protein